MNKNKNMMQKNEGNNIYIIMENMLKPLNGSDLLKFAFGVL